MVFDPVAIAHIAEPTMGARPSMVSFVSMVIDASCGGTRILSPLPKISIRPHRTRVSFGRWRCGLGLAGEAEGALADEVALDLVRPRPDRGRLVVEPGPLPRAVARVLA